MITGAEVATIAKVGSSVAKNVTAALNQPPSRWPNLHEALMELYVILDDWCAAAEESNRAAHRSLEARLKSMQPPDLGKAEVVQVGSLAQMNIAVGGSVVGVVFGGYIERTTGDIKDVLSPSTPWYLSWRRSRARAAARRTLRSVLRIYCADLLDDFEAAVAARESWVIENRQNFKATLEDPSIDLGKLKVMVSQMDDTLAGLLSARVALYRLINESFPLKATTD